MMDRPTEGQPTEAVTLSIPHMRLYVGEYEVPYVEAVAVQGTSAKYNLIVDDRFGLLCDWNEIVRLAPVLAHLIAAAHGYPNFEVYAQTCQLRRRSLSPAYDTMVREAHGG